VWTRKQESEEREKNQVRKLMKSAKQSEAHKMGSNDESTKSEFNWTNNPGKVWWIIQNKRMIDERINQKQKRDWWMHQSKTKERLMNASIENKREIDERINQKQKKDWWTHQSKTKERLMNASIKNKRKIDERINRKQKRDWWTSKDSSEEKNWWISKDTSNKNRSGSMSNSFKD
jgi:hypothetical protein